MAVRPKIIYVEDNKADGELFRRNLERSAVSAELLILNNSDCMTRLQGIAVDDGDVLIFDLKMPGQSGIGILQQVRTIPAYDATPVVMFSGSLGPQEKAECLRNGASLCLEKPRRASEWVKLFRA